MKKKTQLWMAMSCLALTLTACAGGEDVETTQVETEPSDAVTTADGVATWNDGGNFTDEMKIPHTVNLHIYGADSVERNGDHENSPYFISYDFYNMESHDSLVILPQFKTQQQTSEWSCGPACLLMILEYYGIAGEHNEETLAALRSNNMNEEATKLSDMVAILESQGLAVESTYDYGEEVYDYLTLSRIQEILREGKPVLIGWNDWGGHWQVIIGYDDMGTSTESDDVIIVADPYDTTDHNQDGYGIYPAERWWYNFTMYDFMTETFAEDGFEERDFLFAVPTMVRE